MTWGGGRRWRAAACAVAGLVLVLLLLILAADAGLLNGVAKAVFTARTHRALSFRRLRPNFFSLTPTIEVDDLVIGSPAAITPRDLAHVGHGLMQIKLAPLFLARVTPVAIALEDVDLKIVRLGVGQNNYSFGAGGPGGFLRSVRAFTVTRARVSYDDPPRCLVLNGRAAYDSAAPSRPLHLEGGGLSHGEPYTLFADGGELIRRAPGEPYPFNATLTDGRVRFDAVGRSAAPFDFRSFDLLVRASGPNLADLGYVFNVPAANTPDFQLTSHAVRQGQVVRFGQVRARIGGSDVEGAFTSDHTRPRRRLIFDVRSRRIRAEDLLVLFAPRPAHAVARASPGVAGPVSKVGALRRPIPVDRLQKLDLTVAVTADEVTGYAAPLRDVTTKVDLADGKLSLERFDAGMAGGRVSAAGVLDTRPTAPRVHASIRLSHARLSALPFPVRSLTGGVLDASVRLSGAGGSLKDLLGRAEGSADLRLHDGVIKRIEASALGGDPLQSAWLHLLNNTASTALRCARADFTIHNGHAAARAITVSTGLGLTTGSGEVDFGQDRVDIVLTPAPGSRGRTNVSPPVRITGPLEHPIVAADVKRSIVGAGLAGVATVVTTPLRSLSAPVQSPASACPPPPG